MYALSTRARLRGSCSRALAVAALAGPAAAQITPAPTPGQPSYGALDSTQATRFSSEFNPAFSFAIDAIGDYRSFDDGSEADGFDLELRALELVGQAWVDPRAWAYFTAATEGEELAIEEAAVHWVGFGGNRTLRAGRFFIDFGKQMQTHVHELRTVERPLVLRAYLGEEVKGDGLQWDDWRPLGDETVLRWSVGAFASLLPEEAEFAGFEPMVAERKDFDELNFTARLTGFTELSEQSTLQLGLSARAVPDYSVEFAETGDTAAGLSSAVYGLDATWSRVDDTGQRRWTVGTELLLSSGENGAENPAPGTVDVLDDTVSGYFAYADWAWSRFDSAGVQFSTVELPVTGQPDVSEVEVYYSHLFSEYQRLRCGVSAFDAEDGEDSSRFVIQYTAVLGAHGHGVNW